jgi:AraC-like DNA-binding protein/mannose-6-phosphate isomerase-like protein (cupin superfamily)
MENNRNFMDDSRISGHASRMHHGLRQQRPEGFPGQRLVIVPAAIVVQASRQPVTRDLCVTHIGNFSAAGGHFVNRPHGTSQHILIACLSGKGTCILAGQEWKLGPGDLLFLPPRETHTYHADPNAPWTIFWMHFRGQRAADYLASLGVSSARPLASVDDPEVLFEAFEDTFRHATHGFNEAAMTGMTTAFARLLGLIKVHQRVPGSRSRRVDDRILKVLAQMRDDLAHPWTLAALASSANLSVPHFTELCRRQTGLPPLGLLIRLRLQRAMDLLQQGGHNVAEASLAVGYDDPFYFSRLFRKHMGVPPSTCRQGP